MKKLQLLLTNPCAERWEAMQPLATGRYCEGCEKNIVDLTSKSDAELILFFKNKKANVCARLLSSQLHREIAPPTTILNHWTWLLPLAAGTMVILPTQAQQLRPTPQVQQLTDFSDTSVNKLLKTSSSSQTIKGSVLEESTGRPLLGVKIRQKGFQNVLAITDSTGKFELTISEGKVLAEFIFELAGFAPVNAYPSQGMVVRLPVQRAIVLGGITSFSSHQG
ncbi:MAG: hypothetical protein ACQUHE_06505, partial [Bacteroidia bacterium]